ncbi:N-acetylmuramoyl-L-alanine amidase [Flavonifractor hominis]|uniref:N-acetylmuramoyl-L-alanine amidase n=1 Tax=Flavonifractor hominis TaxID=3133178 RepID=A0ABV1ELU7_9FIRM
MKKTIACLLTVVLLALLLPVGAVNTLSVYFYDESSQRYGELTQTDQVTLTLDGAPLVPEDAPALVQYPQQDQNGRTLVPVRLIAEALGISVTWVPETRQVLLLQEDKTIVLTLGSDTALVDGQSVQLPDGVPAGVVKYDGRESTMVPLRFVSEQLGATVEWDNDTFTAQITSPGYTETPVPTPTPTPTPTPSPTPVVPEEGDNGYVSGITVDAEAHVVTITTDHTPVYRVLDLGDRVAIDLLGAVLTTGADSGEITTLPVDSDLLESVRYYQHGDDLGYGYPHTLRVVLDLKDGITYAGNVAISAGANNVRVTLIPPAETPTDPSTPTTPTNPNAYTIALDAGHGGSSPGAVYPDASGQDVLEKDLTLAITTKLETILVQQGYNVVLTRPGDSTVDLYTRADIANAANADLFVSIHINASGTVPSFQGIYTYHYPSSTRSMNFATAVQQAVCAATGGIDRGISSANFAVLRETNMAAVLVECGFMSNLEELSRLQDDAYQQKLAEGIATGIANYLSTL